MRDICIISDFDGTITKKDSLFDFFDRYADKEWLNVEQEWSDGKISSKECLQREFDLVYDLSEELIDNYLEEIEVDENFASFYKELKDKNIDFLIVSDGVDYFINKILKKAGISGIEIVSNHGEFADGRFLLTFPNDSLSCKNNAGTCKCSILKQKKEKYKKIVYLGDGTSDFCAANKADILYAKTKLYNYCKEQGIKVIYFETFKDIVVK